MCETQEAVMRLFREKSMTISQSGSIVTVDCDTPADADVLWTWLASISGKYGTVDDWLSEVFPLGTRRDYMDNPRVTEHWVRYAFEAGRHLCYCEEEENLTDKECGGMIAQVDDAFAKEGD